MLSIKLKRNLILWGLFIVAGGLVGAGYSQVIGGQLKHGFSAGCVLTAGVIGFELFWVQSKFGNRLRSLPLSIFILVSTLVWAVIIALSLQIVPVLILGEVDAYGPDVDFTSFEQDMIFALAVSFIFNAVLRLRSLIGSRVFSNFMLGRYHQPVRENRVFMFLDLADSTHLSEKLGDLRVQALIARFFFDIAQPIAEHGGETHRYIGDEVVVTWNLDEVRQTSTCIDCVFAIQRKIEAQAASYQQDFDLLPEFRIGMHGGPVVAGEVGDDKREIVYFGDTINSTARLQALCKDKQRDFLISQDLLDQLSLPDTAVAEELGEVSLRGRKQPLSVVAVKKQ
ncbi:MAG: adenylate cyclase [Planctomycetota bacterium]|jgi:adenylate cyclase